MWFKRLYPSAPSLHCQDSRQRNNINRAVFPLHRLEMSSHICGLKLSKIVNFLQKYLSHNSKAASIHPNNIMLHIAQLGVPGSWSLHKVRIVPSSFCNIWLHSIGFFKRHNWQQLKLPYFSHNLTGNNGTLLKSPISK